MTSDTPSTPVAPSRTLLIAQSVRSACHLIIVVSVAIWAFTDWPFPLPAVLTGIGFTALAVLVWALFLSPRPVLRTDRFGRALIELLFIAAGVGALLALGVPWVAAVAFGVLAAALGYLVPERIAAA